MACVINQKSRNITRNRAEASKPEIIDNFFRLIKTEYDKIENEQKKCLNAEDVNNLDEIDFNGEQNCKKIICRKSSKNIKKIQGDNSKTMYTVLACCNAAGEFLPPHVIYKSKHLYRDWCIGGPKDTSYNSTKSGWMESNQWLDGNSTFGHVIQKIILSIQKMQHILLHNVAGLISKLIQFSPKNFDNIIKK